MNKIIQCIILTLTFWVVLYFLGAFAHAEMNIKLWNHGSRAGITCIAGMMFIVAIFITYKEDL